MTFVKDIRFSDLDEINLSGPPRVNVSAKERAAFVKIDSAARKKRQANRKGSGWRQELKAYRRGKAKAVAVAKRNQNGEL